MEMLTSRWPDTGQYFHQKEENYDAREMNTTGDVFYANCVSNPDGVACVRAGLVAVLALSTAFVCFVRIVRLHATSPSSHLRLLLYYLLLVHCIAGSFEWLIGWKPQVSLFIAYTRAMQLLVICYFYLDVASRMMHWSSNSGRRLCFIALFLFFSYFTAFLAMGFLLSIEPKLDCRASIWIWFSAGECLIVQLMVGSFYLILRRMDRISAPLQIRTNQKRDVFVLFWSFETATLVDLGYHISLYLLSRNSPDGCSGIFMHNQMRYSMLKAPYDVIAFVLPVWATLFTFRFNSKRDVSSENSEESTLESSASRTFLADVVTVRNWRRRYRPLTQPTPEERPVLPSQRRQQLPRTTSATPPTRLRSVSSAPMIRRVSVSRSIVSSPLYSIPEELQGPAPPYVPIVSGSLGQLSTMSLLD